MKSLSRKDLVLLVALTLAWGLTWPVMKMGVRQLPPLFFRAISAAGGLALLVVYARATGVPLRLARADRVDIVRLAIPNVVIWQVAVILAMTLLPAGRGAILGYTMPLWAALIGALFYGEHPAPRQWVGIGAAMVAAALLLSSELQGLAGHPAGTALMLAAAASWGYGMHEARRRATHMHALATIVWMFVVALVALVGASAAFEFDRWRMPRAGEWLTVGYSMAVSMAFCHVVWLRLARRLPAAASGLSMMMIPVVGVFSGQWLLGESPRWQDYAALALIVFSLATALLPSRRGPPDAEGAEAPLASRTYVRSESAPRCAK